MASSSSSSPCAACKFLRRKCTTECVFAPYFPPDQPHKFANVHKIFGASNITKLLNELPVHQREDAVNSLAYEADARVKDPVYGCVGAISVLQRQVAQLQNELALAHSDLARYAGAGMVVPAVGQPGGGGGGGSASSSLEIAMGLSQQQQQASRDQHRDLTTEQLIQIASRDPNRAEQSRLSREREHIIQLLRSEGGLEQLRAQNDAAYAAEELALGSLGGSPLGPFPSNPRRGADNANRSGSNTGGASGSNVRGQMSSP